MREFLAVIQQSVKGDALRYIAIVKEQNYTLPEGNLHL